MLEIEKAELKQVIKELISREQSESLDAVEAAAWERIKAVKGPRTKARPSRDLMKR